MEELLDWLNDIEQETEKQIKYFNKLCASEMAAIEYGRQMAYIACRLKTMEILAKCQCEFPVIRTDNVEYCGICGKDIKNEK